MSWEEVLFNLSDGMTPMMAARAEAEAVARAIRTRPAEARILYVPRRTRERGEAAAWLVDVSDGLPIPSNIELMFAPGAALLPVAFGPPSERATLDIAGPLTAPTSLIFGTTATAAFQRPGLADVGLRVARVCFTGDALDHVRPEWWGAGSGDAHIDTEALAAAIRAAHEDRRVGVRWLRPLAVELTREYLLERTLWVGSDTDVSSVNPGVFAMRGTPRSTEKSHMNCDLDRFSGDAMLAVQGVEAVRIEGVSFNGASRVAACVRILSLRESTNVAEHGHELLRCVLRGATESLVAVQPVGRSGEGSADALTLEGCQLRPVMRPLNGTSGLHLDLRAKDGVHVRSCSFVGSTGAMILARAGTVTMSHCYLRNESTASGGYERDPLEVHRHGPEGGLDVLLDANQDGPAALHATHCLSHSPQFLAAVRSSVVLGRDTTITALRHDPLPVPADVVLERPEPPLGPFLRPWQPDKILPDPAVLKSGIDTKLVPDLALQSLKADIQANLNKGSEQPLTQAKVFSVLKYPASDGVGLPIVNDLASRAGSSGRGGSWRPPSAIVWDGNAQLSASLTLCGCRFDGRDRPDARPAVYARNPQRPLVELGVLASTAVSRSVLIDATSVQRPVPVTLIVPTA